MKILKGLCARLTDVDDQYFQNRIINKNYKLDILDAVAKTEVERSKIKALYLRQNEAQNNIDEYVQLRENESEEALQKIMDDVYAVNPYSEEENIIHYTLEVLETHKTSVKNCEEIKQSIEGNLI